MRHLAKGHAVLNFDSGHCHVPSALRDVAEFLARADLRPGLIEDATIALAEALNNIEEHAYSGRRDLPVLLRVIVADQSLRCEIEDRGTPLPGGSLPAGRMPTSDALAHEKLPEGGFGWALLRRLTRELSYQRRGDWNRLLFTIS